MLVPPGYGTLEEHPWVCLIFRKPLLQVRETTASDPAFLAIAATIADAIVEGSSQSYPTEEFEPG